MKYVPWHVKGVRATPRDAAGDMARRTGLSVGAAFAMIRKDIQELRRQTSRPQAEPVILEQRLHELAAQIGALQEAAGGGPGQDAFLRQLQALLAQNLAVLQQQVTTSAVDAIRGPAEAIRRDVASLKEIQASVDRRTQDTFEAVYGTIERIVDRLAAIEEELRERSSGLQAGPAAPAADEMPSADELGWADMPPVRESAPEAQPPVPADGLGTAAMLRRPAAVPASALAPPSDAPAMPDAAEPEGGVRSPRPPAPAALLTSANRAVQAVTGLFKSSPSGMRGRSTGHPHGRLAVLGVAAGLLVLFAITFALDYYQAPAGSGAGLFPVAGMGADAGPPEGEPPLPAGPSSDQPSARPEAGKETSASDVASAGPSLAASPEADPVADGAATTAAVPAEQDKPLPTRAMADAAPWDADTLMRNIMLPAPAGRDPWPPSASVPDRLRAAPLPAAIGGKALLAAAQAGDPAASYEVAVRFAQGRNAVAPDFARAAAWLERAAQSGLAPAQFRLGSMYEKGLGVRKDLSEARRLYMAAAAKGHAKAMHNLAVLYTRGIGGAPDYGAAAEWFRKAAAYGTLDSQYNLGILYARGTGVERDLAESYKWFALAAKGGDKDAAHKRDEVARGLDAKQLESAKASVDTFVAVPQPEEATVVRVPAGGWDQVATAATQKSRAPSRPERFPGK